MTCLFWHRGPIILLNNKYKYKSKQEATVCKWVCLVDRQCLASNGQVRFIVSQIGKVAHSKKRKKKKGK